MATICLFFFLFVRGTTDIWSQKCQTTGSFRLLLGQQNNSWRPGFPVDLSAGQASNRPKESPNQVQTHFIPGHKSTVDGARSTVDLWPGNQLLICGFVEKSYKSTVDSRATNQQLAGPRQLLICRPEKPIISPWKGPTAVHLRRQINSCQ